MPEAVRAVIRFGFGRMELNRIQARCIAENSDTDPLTLFMKYNSGFCVDSPTAM